MTKLNLESERQLLKERDDAQRDLAKLMEKQAKDPDNSSFHSFRNNFSQYNGQPATGPEQTDGR